MSARKSSPAIRKAPARLKPARTAPTMPLLSDLRALILDARQRVAQTVNAGLTLLYWNIGTRIRKDILKEKRAEYGAEIVSALGRQLEAEFGRGFGRRNLFNMIRFAEVLPDGLIVQSLIAQLNWTHFLSIIYLNGIHVAKYLTELPPRELLRERFHHALALTRARLENREE